MAYNRENYGRIRRMFEEKNRDARERAQTRALELHLQIPELAEVDTALSATGVRIMEAITGGGDREARLAAVREENMALQARHRAILAAHGYPTDETEPKYECKRCSDNGFADGKMCDCLRDALVLAGYESAGISYLMRDMTFENYRPAYFDGDGDHAEVTAYKNLQFCKQYAAELCETQSKNLLLVGATGLGKTHLSVAIVRTAVERGLDALYVSASNMFSDFEHERFSRPYGEEDHTSRTARYFDCELLAIDDLGAEVSNQFTVACLYNLLNTREQQGKSTLVNTNLSPEELRKRYSDRITSRLFGTFRALQFLGGDVRQKKLRERRAAEENS